MRYVGRDGSMVTFGRSMAVDERCDVSFFRSLKGLCHGDQFCRPYPQNSAPATRLSLRVSTIFATRRSSIREKYDTVRYEMLF